MAGCSWRAPWALRSQVSHIRWITGTRLTFLKDLQSNQGKADQRLWSRARHVTKHQIGPQIVQKRFFYVRVQELCYKPPCSTHYLSRLTQIGAEAPEVVKPQFLSPLPFGA